MKASLVLPLTIALLMLNTGCSTTQQSGASGGQAYYRSDAIDKLWLAEGFDFSGYDVLLVTETKTEGVTPKDEKEAERLNVVQTGLRREFATAIGDRNLFQSVVTKETDIQPGAKALKLENTILKFSRGSSAARYAVGFGAGMPYVKIRGQVTEVATGKPLFIFEIDETGNWFGSGFTSSRILQSHATMELVDDIATFISRIAKHEKIALKKI